MNAAGGPGKGLPATLSLFAEDTSDQPNPPVIPPCIWCVMPPLRRGGDGRPAHCRDGLAHDSGRTRPTRYGREAIVWVST